MQLKASTGILVFVQLTVHIRSPCQAGNHAVSKTQESAETRFYRKHQARTIFHRAQPRILEKYQDKILFKKNGRNLAVHIRWKILQGRGKVHPDADNGKSPLIRFIHG
jgi:hypothetical protein